MATAYITEYQRMAYVGGANFGQMAEEPEIASQTVAIGAEAQSDAFNVQTQFVRVHVDAICSILFGPDPTATTANRRLAANQTEYFGVPEGASFKISVISNT